MDVPTPTPSAAVSPLRQRMLDDMRMRQFAEHTQEGYIRAVRKLSTFLGRSPHTATAAAGIDPRPCSAASSVLRRDPTSRVRGSSLYALGLFDALCGKRLPTCRRTTRDLPVPEQGACARAQGL